MLASGDLLHIAQSIGQSLGLDQILGDLTPEEKVAVVRREATMRPVMMVGDGINDAPALAAADVGVAMGARGAAASSEAAGVVLLVDELLPLDQSSKHCATNPRSSPCKVFSWALDLSIVGMMAAAFGYLPPVQGALFQEAIDVAVIVNALRALR